MSQTPHTDHAGPSADPESPLETDVSPIPKRQAALGQPLHIHFIAAMLLGALLVGFVLYMWRRPVASGDPKGMAATKTASSAPLPGDARATGATGATGAPVDAKSELVLSAPRTIACHDRGSKKTSPEDCDHVAPLEQALTHAVEQSKGCAGEIRSELTVNYQLDVSFARRRVLLGPDRSERRHPDKNVTFCIDSVRHALGNVVLEGINHEHSRYKIAITATYPSGS